MYIRKLRMYILNFRLYIRNLRIYFMCGGKEVYVRPPPGLPGEPHSFHSVPSRTAGMTKAAPADMCGGSRRARVIARGGVCAGLLISV